ncbi:hypothetical protein HDE_11509 [Halotydeus destructor]|nr:hypothetical protein HDE_11509 [Halotydeus destructor]
MLALVLCQVTDAKQAKGKGLKPEVGKKDCEWAMQGYDVYGVWEFVWNRELSPAKVDMKVVDFLIYCLKVLWKYTDKVLGVLLYYFGYRRVRITFYGAFLCCGFLLQSYDTGDTHLHTSVTKYDATINLYKILSPILLLRLSVDELFGKKKAHMTVAEIFNKTPPTEKFIGDCGVHDRKGGYGEIPDCLPTEQFTVKKFLDKDLLGYAIQLTDSDTPFQGHEVYGGGIPPYLWQFDFGKNVTDFLEAATAANSVKVYVHLFPSYVTSFGQGVTEPYGMTALSWDGYNNVLVNGKFSISYKLRHITRLEWPMDSDCRDYPGSSRGKCMNDCNHSAMKKMKREGKLNGTLPLNFRLFEHDAMFQDLKLALNKDYKTNETNAILKEVYEECGHQCQRRECAETLIEPTVVAATRDRRSGVRLYAPNKPKNLHPRRGGDDVSAKWWSASCPSPVSGSPRSMS